MKKSKKYAIITASDEKYGDFLVNHWLNSLIDNVDCRKIEIIILNYGLNKNQKQELLSKGARILNCNRDGHIVNIRYSDIFRFLEKNYYEQIMVCDGGDLIFQRDISRLFEQDKNSYRAVCEETSHSGSNMIEYAILQKSFSPKITAEIDLLLKDKTPINGGLFLGPYGKIKKLCLNMNNLILNKNIYGPDQVILNYTLYKGGFKELSRTFNYTLFSSKIMFEIHHGVFFEKGKKIAVVHNSGNKQIYRVVKNFGYGPEYNRIKWLSYFIFKAFYKIVNLNLILKSLRKIVSKK